MLGDHIPACWALAWLYENGYAGETINMYGDNMYVCKHLYIDSRNRKHPFFRRFHSLEVYWVPKECIIHSSRWCGIDYRNVELKPLRPVWSPAYKGGFNPRIEKYKRVKKILLKQKKKVEVEKVKKATFCHPFYNAEPWLTLKKKILKLYGTECMRCGIRNVEMHVDHIKPRSKYRHLELSPLNLQVLCRNHNLQKSNKDETDYRPMWAKTYDWSNF